MLELHETNAGWKPALRRTNLGSFDICHGISEEETVLLVRRVSDFREELAGANRERRQLMGALRSAIHEDGTDEEISAKLEALKELDKRLNNIKSEFHEKLSEGLDARQQAKLYVFLQEFEANMRRMIQRVRERGRAMENGRMGRDGFDRGGPRHEE